MSVISVKDLSFKFESSEKEVLRDVSFTIDKGEYVTILGPNGSGKSTLAKLLVGLLNKKNGEISLFDTPLDKRSVYELRKRIGIVFQNPDNQFIGATVEDDIAFGLENRQIKKEEMRDIVYEYANKLGMSSFLSKEPSNLSGGQKQRVAIAGVLALKPDLLILDEATSMLDPKGKKDILSLINDIKNENKDLTIVSITHDVDEALFSDRVIIINNASIIKDDKPEVVFKDEQILKDNHLSIPFNIEVMNVFKDKHISPKDTLEEISEKLCK